MLLSVCGTNAICLNRLHTNSEENAIKLQALIGAMIQGKALGEAVRLLSLPVPTQTPVLSNTGMNRCNCFVSRQYCTIMQKVQF